MSEEEALVTLAEYLKQAPKAEEKQRMGWHLEKYRFSQQFINKHSIVADIGCGLGFGSKLLADKSRMVYAFDINPELIGYLKEKYGSISNIEWNVFNVETDELSEEQFDLVCLYEVLEHLHNPLDSLRKIRKSLKKGAFLLLSVPNSALIDSKGSNRYHQTGFNLDSLNKLLRIIFSDIRYYSQGYISWKFFLKYVPLNIKKYLPSFIKISIRRLLTLQSNLTNEGISISSEKPQQGRWIVAVCRK